MSTKQITTAGCYYHHDEELIEPCFLDLSDCSKRRCWSHHDERRSATSCCKPTATPATATPIRVSTVGLDERSLQEEIEFMIDLMETLSVDD